MKRAILILMITMFVTGGITAADLKIDAFSGTWSVDFDRTMEEAKKSPKYDGERVPAMIKRMMAKMKIDMTDKEMTYIRGAKEMKMPFTVKSSDDQSVTVSVKQGDQEATIKFTLIDGAFMNFNSSGSDDMDYYIWKKAE